MHAAPMFGTRFTNLFGRSERCVLALSLLLIIWANTPAEADELWGFVQITCTPELGYFSIRRFFVLDPPHKGPYLTEGLEPGPSAVSALQLKYGIFDSGNLKNNPFECSIPPVKGAPGWNESRPGYKVRVVGHLDKNSQESDYHLIADNAEVYLQNASLGLLVLNLDEGIDSTEVWYDALLEVRTCRVTPGSDTANAQNLTCRYEPFKGGTR